MRYTSSYIICMHVAVRVLHSCAFIHSCVAFDLDAESVGVTIEGQLYMHDAMKQTTPM